MNRAFKLDDIRWIAPTGRGPIGIRYEAAAQDQYDSHARQIEAMLDSGASVLEPTDWLMTLETDIMGLVSDRALAMGAAERRHYVLRA